MAGIAPKPSGVSTPAEAPLADTTIGIIGDCCGDCGACTADPCGNPCNPVASAPDPAPGCAQQVIVNLVPQEYLNWYNDTVDYVAAHGSCAGAPAEPSSIDWAAMITTATLILTAFDWDHPPLPWSPNQFISGGIRLCPGVDVLRYLSVAPIDGAGHVGYVWDNSDHPAGDGFLPELCPIVGGPALSGVFSGLFWFGSAFDTPCASAVNGIPILSASACRFRGISSICESLITQNFVDSGGGVAACDSRVVTSCGLITAADGQCLYAGGGGPGFFGFGGLSPRDPGSAPNLTPAVGWVDWTFAPCFDCACP